MLNRALWVLRAELAAVSVFDGPVSGARLLAVATLDDESPTALGNRCRLLGELTQLSHRCDGCPWVASSRSSAVGLGADVLIVALVSGGTTVGALQVLRHALTPFGIEDRRRACGLADSATALLVELGLA